MGRKAGTAKTGGRKKGTPNKVPPPIRGWLEELINDNRDQIREDLRNMDAADRVKIFEKFISYVCLKKQELSFDQEVSALLNSIDKLNVQQLICLEEIIIKLTNNG